jgi:subtilisin family serine protease
MATRKKSKRRSKKASRKPAPRGGTAVAAALGAEARTVVYVHGIGNKPEADVLKCQWDTALFGFDLGERSRLAYWVSREYYPEPEAATCASGDLVAMGMPGDARGIGAFAQGGPESLAEGVGAIAKSKAEQRALLAIAGEIESALGAGDAVEREFRARDFEARVAPLPRRAREWLTRRLTGALLQDVHDLFFVPERRQLMRDSVLERLKAGGGPFVVIGHSQGSMIAYDVLCKVAKEHPEIEVPLFVTIGSPLGLKEVQDQIKKLTNQRKLAVPGCVSRWLNVADPLDPVALDKKLRKEYAPTNGVGIEDDREWNPDSPRHPHSGTGYLQTKPVHRAVHETVETALFQPVAPFVIARDVVKRLETSSAAFRHKILIELVDPAKADSVPLDTARDRVVECIEQLSGLEESDDRLRVERLQRYVSARLTRAETEALAHELAAPGLKSRSISRVWRNATKRALLRKSIHTVQAHPAHVAYDALGTDVVWAVLDSGVAASHKHFAAHATIKDQFDCTKSGAIVAGSATDEHGHGTHVAGIIAGELASAGGETVSGIAPRAGLHIYKVLDRDGSGDDAWIIKALDHVSATNEQAGRLVIHGVNLSLGGAFDQSSYACGHSPLCRELHRLWRQGVLVVIAAGNEGFATLESSDGPIDANMDLSVGDPANLEEAIAVGSVHKENPHSYGISYFSSRGPTADGRQKPDCVAPGERILSCRHKFPASSTDVAKLYVEMSGTSMAAPHVSGVLAAFLSRRREFIGQPDRVKEILLAGCTDLGRDRPMQGAGLPNLVRMLIAT